MTSEQKTPLENPAELCVLIYRLLEPYDQDVRQRAVKAALILLAMDELAKKLQI